MRKGVMPVLPERLYLVLHLLQLALVSHRPVAQLVHSGMVVHASTAVRELERAETFIGKPKLQHT